MTENRLPSETGTSAHMGPISLNFLWRGYVRRETGDQPTISFPHEDAGSGVNSAASRLAPWRARYPQILRMARQINTCCEVHACQQPSPSWQQCPALASCGTSFPHAGLAGILGKYPPLVETVAMCGRSGSQSHTSNDPQNMCTPRQPQLPPRKRPTSRSAEISTHRPGGGADVVLAHPCFPPSNFRHKMG